MKFNLSIIFILITCNIIGNNLYAEESKSGSSGSRSWLLSKGAAAREAKRFTLQEWLENKERRNLMDMWLSINTPSPYEFTLSAEQYRYSESITLNSTTTTSAFNNTQIDFSAYARFVGISVEYSNNLEQKLSDLNGLFNIRLFGQTIQGSHLTLHYGLRYGHHQLK